MNDGMIIRKGVESDQQAVHAINCRCFVESWSQSGIAGAFSGGFDLYVVVQGDVLCAYILSCDILDEVHIMQVAVDDQWRRQGLAVELSQTLLAEKSSMQVVYLEVRASNIAAQTLYQGLGFTVCGQRKGYYAARKGHPAEDAVLMQLPVDGGYNG